VAFFIARSAIGDVEPALIAVFCQTPRGFAEMLNDFFFNEV
jgi:hypothetical protein